VGVCLYVPANLSVCWPPAQLRLSKDSAEKQNVVLASRADNAERELQGLQARHAAQTTELEKLKRDVDHHTTELHKRAHAFHMLEQQVCVCVCVCVGFVRVLG
jgi:hypothetical protein